TGRAHRGVSRAPGSPLASPCAANVTNRGRGDAHSVPDGMVPVLVRGAGGPDRARARLRRTPGPALAQGSRRLEGRRRYGSDPRPGGRGRATVPWNARDLRAPART